MPHTTLGSTNLRVSVAGLGTGGFSRLGLRTGLNEDQSARLIEEAYALGVNFIDTAPSYGTEGVVGKALKHIPRDKVVIATKAQIGSAGAWIAPERVVASLDNSLRLMGTDHVDVFNLHGIELDEYDYALETIAPALEAEKAKGKIRHIGITENPIARAPPGDARIARSPIRSGKCSWSATTCCTRVPARSVFPADARQGRRHLADVCGALDLRRSAAHCARAARPGGAGAGRQGAGQERRSRSAS